jgi:hypothetical protein
VEGLRCGLWDGQAHAHGFESGWATKPYTLRMILLGGKSTFFGPTPDSDNNSFPLGASYVLGFDVSKNMVEGAKMATNKFLQSQ